MKDMKMINDYLEWLNKAEGVKIENRSTDEYLLFSYPSHQPFDFDIQIQFNSIKSVSKFRINVPALNIDFDNVDRFQSTVEKVCSFVNELNKLIDDLY